MYSRASVADFLRGRDRIDGGEGLRDEERAWLSPALLDDSASLEFSR